jgi:putative ABC transport system substrate-binding protein
MRRVLAAMLVLALGGALLAPAAPARVWRVAINQFVEHSALDACRRGFQDYLAEHGYRPGKQVIYDYQNAQANMATAGLIARRQVGGDADLILAIATPSAQATVAAARRRPKPILFTAITDPVGAGLVKNLKNPGGMVSGVSDLSPVYRQIALFKKVMPQLRRLGVIYNPGEANSVTLIRLARAACKKLGLQLIEATAVSSVAVLPAAASLVGKVDALLAPTDNTVVSTLESAVKVAVQNRLPLFAMDVASARRGAALALGMDYYRLGRQTGAMALRFFRGQKLGDMPVETLKRVLLHVNLKTAKKMGLTVPAAIVRRADKVYR